MTKNTRGYMSSVIHAVNRADPKLVGVKLAKVCITKDIPVTEVAEYLKVSRQTVYSWFVGKFVPRPDQEAKINQLLVALK